MSGVQVVTADEARVGITATMTQATFKKLLKLAATPDMEGWSSVIAKLIEKVTP